MSGYGIEIYDELGNKLIEENTMIPRIKYGIFLLQDTNKKYVELSGIYTIEITQPVDWELSYTGGCTATVTRIGNELEVGFNTGNSNIELHNNMTSVIVLAVS